MKTKVKKDYKSAVKHALTGETTGRDLINIEIVRILNYI